MAEFTLPSGRVVETHEPLFGEYVDLTTGTFETAKDLIYAKFALIVPGLTREEIAVLPGGDGRALLFEVSRIWDGRPEEANLALKQWWAAVIHGLEPKEGLNGEGAIAFNDYVLARLAGRLNWSFLQVKTVPLEVALLCEQLGWRGPEGFERLQNSPNQVIADWLVIAKLEKEEAKHKAQS